ncbi:hypothetical protein ASG39_07880 [Rhizobium sp. Leaf371]|nr:hypothetical protein ASG39_07880 [Rhizobium sp. Leaf371]
MPIDTACGIDLAIAAMRALVVRSRFGLGRFGVRGKRRIATDVDKRLAAGRRQSHGLVGIAGPSRASLLLAPLEVLPQRPRRPFPPRLCLPFRLAHLPLPSL